jgi:hypothetical protein
LNRILNQLSRIILAMNRIFVSWTRPMSVFNRNTDSTKWNVAPRRPTCKISPLDH